LGRDRVVRLVIRPGGYLSSPLHCYRFNKEELFAYFAFPCLFSNVFNFIPITSSCFTSHLLSYVTFTIFFFVPSPPPLNDLSLSTLPLSTIDIQIIQPKAVVKSGKKVAPAPYAAGAKPATAAKKNPLFEKTPKNFGIGSSISIDLYC
jgi:hypothetical protein